MTSVEKATVRSGLSEAEAAVLLERHGENRVVARRPVPVWRRVLDQLRDPMVLVLLVAIVLTLATGDYQDAIIVAFVVVVNTAVGVVQGMRAEDAVAALSALSAPTARVRRDGVTRSVEAGHIVPGDVLELATGDVVPADADLLDTSALLLDESAITGESVPVDKVVPAGGGAAVYDSHRVSAGTVVVRGRAIARVTATGASSTMGRIAGLLDAGPTLTPLQRRLAGLGRALAVVAGVLCVLVAVLGLLRGQPLELMAVTAISLVVAAVPESLPAVVTLSLALGARRMAARQAIVRRLAAVETLGSVTILATDKTGTLTDGQMVVEWLWTPTGEAAVTGTGYGPEGQVLTGARPMTASTAPALADLLSAGALCNDAVLEPPTAASERWSAVGDPTEAALLAAAGKLGAGQGRAGPEGPVSTAGAQRVAEVPFDSLRRRMTTLHRLLDGRFVVTCKGAPEVVLDPVVLGEPESVLAAASARAAAFARDGYRVLAVAQLVSAEHPGDLSVTEKGLRLLGLVAIADPPRAAARATIAACQEAGITPVLITGDHVATARSIGERLGIIGPGDPVASGGQLTGAGRLDPTGVRVFARTTPEQKLDVIQAWRDAGQVVAMTGDGVNDGPALRRSDIGVAMGGRGTEVARQAADLVLADDDLATVVVAVEEGRRVYANVRRFLLYGLAGGTAEILVMLVGPLLGLALPLLPAQILWVNLMTHGMPGVALGAEPADPKNMHRPPRPPDQSVLGAGLWQRILQLGLVIAATSVGVGWWAHEHGGPWQSMLFVTLGATQLGAAIGVRARPGTWANPFLLWATAAAFGLQVLAVYLPPLQDLLSTEPLSLAQLGAVSAASVIGYLVSRLQTERTNRAAASAAGPAVADIGIRQSEPPGS
jgi:Ca2+-transporting ATPase